jgi:hypothetical protein
VCVLLIYLALNSDLTIDWYFHYDSIGWLCGLILVCPFGFGLVTVLVLGTLRPVGTGDARVVMDGWYVKFLPLLVVNCLVWMFN